MAKDKTIYSLYKEDASAASRLFATHPPIAVRIATLRKMESNSEIVQ